MTVSSYFAFLNDGFSSSSSSSSSASSTENSRRSLSFRFLSQPQLEPQSQSFTPRSSLILAYPHANSQVAHSSNDETDVWGHHIDPAEAEAEIIRHSKILSGRAVAPVMYQ
jgi:hypothetical protein